jgi:HlyD family secretion protein
MDRKRNKPKFAGTGRAAVIMVVIGVMAATGVTLASIDFSSHRVDRNKISINTVERGDLAIRVGASGSLQSLEVEHMAAQVAGRVAQLHVRPGAQVAAGDLLVKLTNPQLVASAEEAQSAWDGAVGELQALKAELHTRMLNQEGVLVQARFALEKAELQLEAESRLVGRQVISELDYKRSQLNVEQAKQLYRIEQSRLDEIRDNIKVQLSVAESRVEQMARALDRAHDHVNSLSIKAGIDGVVQGVDVEVGQQLQPGSPIGRVAKQDSLYAELRVPAREAAAVRLGQRVVIDTRNGVAEGEVTRVDPGVTDGAVIVDVDLLSVPAGARPQLQVEGTVYVDEFVDTMFVGRPAYVKADSAISVYRLDDSGRYAERTQIRVGRLSLTHVQVIEGLRVGDRIITSEISEWKDQDRILLN